MKHNTSKLFLKFATIAVLASLPFAASAADNLENSLAITKPETLKLIEAQGFSLGDLITPGARTGVLDNSELAKSNFKPVLDNLRAEMALYQRQNPKSGVGMSFDQRLFDLNYLTHGRARFVLVGVINRMDLAYKNSENCGEVRFIYRLAYNVQNHDLTVSSRLPITVNLVFDTGSRATCQSLAKVWLQTNAETSAQDLIATGPLSANLFDRQKLKDLELNLQISRIAASGRPDFGGHAEYLLKVYHWNGHAFDESTLENQIDRDRLKADPTLMTEFANWLTQPENVKAIDAGTVIMPKKFLAKRAISIAPGGINRSGNRLFYSLLPDGITDRVRFEGLENIKSTTGFLRRLNESTCIGCHQTRAIGGFHFTGRDPMGKYAGNSVFLPGSAHYIGDLARRKAVLDETAAGGNVDYSRGFAARPQARRSQNILGTGLYNGWGAHCASGDDASFKGWTCAQGLTCKTLMDKKDGLGMGICLSETQQVGDPCEQGTISSSDFGVDRYVRTSKKLVVTVPNAMCSPQSQEPGTKTGGFLNGNVRTLSCDNLPAEASCGPLPASKPGFNDCIGKKNFDTCLKEFSTGVGLRGCDQKNPCRDDYICSESLESARGSCVPPYFLFQFRVDGHPKNVVQ